MFKAGAEQIVWTLPTPLITVCRVASSVTSHANHLLFHTPPLGRGQEKENNDYNTTPKSFHALEFFIGTNMYQNYLIANLELFK